MKLLTIHLKLMHLETEREFEHDLAEATAQNLTYEEHAKRKLAPAFAKHFEPLACDITHIQMQDV